MTSPPPTHVVGIGASVGGAESLERFFGAFPPDSKMALVVVQSLMPGQEHAMVSTLSKHTQMKVCVAQDGMPLAADTVYVAPPLHGTEIREGRLVLTKLPEDPAAPRDLLGQFLQSVALELGEHSATLLLHGARTSARGPQAIHAAGGVVMAEDPSSATATTRPSAPPYEGSVSHWCPAGELPAEFLRHVGVLEDGASVPPHGLERIVTTVSRHGGVDFHAYKRATVGRRVERRRIASGCETLESYADFLDRTPDERDALVSDLLVGVTRFFRDAEIYDALRPLLVEAVERVTMRPDPTLRVWVPGCSTGEEAYSLAIACLEVIEELDVAVGLKVFASDVNTEALAVAGRGRYPLSIQADVSQARRRRYFSAEPDAFVASAGLRECVVFARHDLLRDPPFTRLDLLSCRNLLIYLDAAAQRRAAQVFRFGLRPGGLLMLGQSETLSGSRAFSTVSERARIYMMENPGRASAGITAKIPQPSAAPPQRPPVRRTHSPGNVDPSAWLLERTLEQLGAPALVLNEAGELAFAFGEIARALRVPAGRAGWKATDLLPDEVASIVSAAIAQAEENRAPVVIEDFVMEDGEGHFRGSMRAVPLEQHGTQTRGVALLFDAPWEPTQASPISVDEAVRRRVQQLETEVSRLRLQLRRAQDELETSTEELQSTNEELVSSNEELQSTNEELQSLNEELHTVNAELQFKVEELSQLSSDLENLLRAVHGGLLFLDHGGRIRRYNDAVLDVLPLVPHDEGRPIGDIATSLIDVDLGHEVERVLQTQLGYEREVRTRDGRAYSLSLQPFSQSSGDHEGVVLTLNDVSTLSDTNERLRNYVRLLDQSPSGIAVASPGEGIEFINEAMCTMLGVAPEELIGRPMSALLHASNDPSLAAALEPKAPRTWYGKIGLRNAHGTRVAVSASIFGVVGAALDVELVAVTVFPL
ncbi:MAG: CheR family methyltransferase [Nannocystaceae bacterium]|nr:PAS domain-containing protein [bacterium]